MSYSLIGEARPDLRTAICLRVKEAVERKLLSTEQLFETYACLKLTDRLDKLSRREQARLYGFCRMLDELPA